MIPTAARAVNNAIGNGGSYSAITGAKIVKSLAKKLHIPSAVAQKSVGNTYTVEQYDKLKPPEMPNLANKTKIGIQRFESSPPKNMINKPPTTEMESSIVKESLRPSFLYMKPERIIAPNSDTVDDKLLL